MQDLINFYENKKVLIAGASGMTGHNLYDLMNQLCCESVIGTCNSNNDYYQDGSEIFIPVDFTNELETKEFFDNNKFDYVFICCAKTYNAKVCQENPECLVLPNVQMVSNILSNCKRTSVKKVLYISSATVYQPSNKNLKEDNLDLNIEPYDIYKGIGWVKRYLEKLCEFYSYIGLDTVVVRPTNIYGRYDKIDNDKCHIIPSIIMRGIRKDNPWVINTIGDGEKNFIYVNDLVRDIALVNTIDNDFSIFNLCSDKTYKIKDIVYIVQDILKIKPNTFFMDKQDYVKYLNLDRNKFDNIFGKQTYTDIHQGLKETIEWYSLLPQTPKKQITD